MKRIILIACCLLAAFSIVVTAALVHLPVYGGFSQRMKNEAAVELEFARAGVEAAGYAYLDHLGAGEAGLSGAFAPRLTVIKADGTVLFDNEYEADRMENHAERPEVRAALAGAVGEETRFSRTGGTQTYYRATPLRDGGVLRIAVSMDSIVSSALALVPVTLAVMPGIFLCALVIASRITRRIVKPVNAINLDTPEENTIYDELSPLLLRIKSQKDEIGRQMAALRQKQLEFGAITDNMREGLLLLDWEGHILSCNRSAIKLLHPQAAVVERQNVLTLRRDEPFRLALEKVLGGVPAECPLSVDSSGEGRRLRLLASPVMDGGTVLGAALLLLDVTEQEDREQLRREFSANVSHELKTPLTVIAGYAELLSKGMVKPENTAAIGEKVSHESARLLDLINDIMQLSRLDEGAPGLEREQVSLSALVNGVVERAAPLARTRDIRLVVDETADGDAVIIGIPQVLHEMVFNLVDNGIKYNKDCGEVVISLTREGGTVRLCVADTGIGIPPAEQERVFERFYRVDKSRNSETGGTGLGLSIVKHGAQLHNAALSLESGPKGTRVSLVFQQEV
jgi:two-component system phosphate regulon sensor histidine kinase PhoR